jgi:hypothetical protein
VSQPLATESIAESGPGYQIDGALLKHARTHTLNHVRPAAGFDDDGVYGLQVQQVAQHEACRTGADNGDLSV